MDSSKKGMYNQTNPMKANDYSKGQQTGKPQQGNTGTYTKPGQQGSDYTKTGTSGGNVGKPGQTGTGIGGKQGSYDTTRKTMPFSGDPNKR